MSLLKAFNTQLLNFIKELHSLYPKDTDIYSALQGSNLMKKTNPRKLLNLFITYVYPYKTEIMNKNEDFFIGKDYQELAEDQDSIMMVLQLKKYWKDMNNDTKNNIWLYFQVLIKLAEKNGA